MRQAMRRWAFQNRSDKSLEDIAHMFNPVLRGWINYYGRWRVPSLCLGSADPGAL